MSDELFGDVGRTGAAAPGPEPEAAPRYEAANRTQIELTPTDLESLLPPGHAARLVWRFVEGLDLQAFYGAIRARDGWAGRPPIDPKILIALWLYATIDGVGSAREVDRLCYAHDAYRWLRGGVSVNYHTLSDFRLAHQAQVDDLLTQSIAVLLEKTVITLNRITQDGTRVRASAGMRSFRGGDRLRHCLRVARQQVERAKQQTDGALTAQALAAQERAARERLARVEQALEALPAVEATKRRNRSKREAKVSTTDPDARVMKMMDGGFRPAYNVQFATDAASLAVVGVAVTTAGSDQAALGPMIDQVIRRTGQVPTAVVVDGGFVSTDGIEYVTARGSTFYAPVPSGRHAPGSGTEAGRSAAITAWRARMASDEAQAVYKVRAATAERLNADVRTHRTLAQVAVRGRAKVLSWVLWVALAENVMRAMGIIPHLMT